MRKRNIVDDPGHEPVNPFRFDLDIPILRYLQVKFMSTGNCKKCLMNRFYVSVGNG